MVSKIDAAKRIHDRAQDDHKRTFKEHIALIKATEYKLHSDIDETKQTLDFLKK